MKTLIIILLPVVMLTTACNPNVYKDKSFFSRNNISDQKLAILPAEVSFMGNLPKSWTTERIKKMEYETSLNLQQELYDDFLFHASKRQIRKKYRVELMDNKVVNDKLQKKGLNPEDTWRLTSEELATILDVDLLVRAKVQNQRYMSQAAASGINIGASVLEGLLNKDKDQNVSLPGVRSGESNLDLSLYHRSQSRAIARFDSERRLRVKNLPVYVIN